MHILIDVGGTNTRVAGTKDLDTFSEPIIYDTPQNFEAWLDKLKTTVHILSGEETVTSIVAGIPCTFREENSVIHSAPNLLEWQGVNIKTKLAETFSCEVSLLNDTALVGLGEAVFGSGQKFDIVAYITISTGVNGVRVTDGKIDRNKFGYEIGHQIVDQNKDIEYFIGGKSLEMRYGMPSKENKAPIVWKEVDHYTGVLAANTIMYWSPAVIIFGGPVTNDINLDNVMTTARTLASRYEKLPEFLRSKLGALGGLYGGMAYLKNK